MNGTPFLSLFGSGYAGLGSGCPQQEHYTTRPETLQPPGSWRVGQSQHPPPARSRPNSSTIRRRTSSRSAALRFMSQPSTDTALRTWSCTTWLPPKIQEFLGRAAAEPSTTSGSIGTFSRIANWNGPSLKGKTCPSRDRVPSGKQTMEQPWRRDRAHCSSARAPFRRSERSTGMSPAMRSIHPRNGNRKSSALTSHFASTVKWEITGISAMDWWLLTITYTWPGTRFSRPEIRIRHGLIFARTRPRRRNQRPVRNRRGSRSNRRTAASRGVHDRIRTADAVQIQTDRSRRNIRIQRLVPSDSRTHKRRYGKRRICAPGGPSAPSANVDPNQKPDSRLKRFQSAGSDASPA